MTRFLRVDQPAVDVVEHGFAEPGASGDHRNIFLEMIDAAIQVMQIRLLEFL